MICRAFELYSAKFLTKNDELLHLKFEGEVKKIPCVLNVFSIDCHKHSNMLLFNLHKYFCTIETYF